LSWRHPNQLGVPANQFSPSAWHHPTAETEWEKQMLNQSQQEKKWKNAGTDDFMAEMKTRFLTMHITIHEQSDGPSQAVAATKAAVCYVCTFPPAWQTNHIHRECDHKEDTAQLHSVDLKSHMRACSLGQHSGKTKQLLFCCLLLATHAQKM